MAALWWSNSSCKIFLAKYTFRLLLQYFFSKFNVYYLCLYKKNCFSGWGPLIWCITSVIFPAHLKAMACGMCASFMWLMTFVLTSTFQAVDPFVGFSIFAGATFISSFFIQFHLPETKGKTFQEIQNMIQGDQLQQLCTEKHDHCTRL